MRVLIAGCGYVGTALGQRLATEGHTVFGLRRDPSLLPGSIHPVAADLVQGRGLDAIPGDLDAVVSAVSPDGRAEDAYRDAYVRAMRNLEGQLERESPAVERWLHASSTAVYGQQDGSWVDETTVPEPSTSSGRLVLAGERGVLETSVPQRVIVRLGGLYGPQRTRLLDRVRRGDATYPAEPTYTNRIHRDDAAGTLAHLLTLPTPAPVYIGVDHDPAERRDVLMWLADRLGAPPPREGPSARRGNKRARNDRLVSSGYRFRYRTFREGYAAILADAA